MEYRQGANVVTAGGDTIGEIDRVVIDPKTKEVTHIVVQKGLLFTENKVVPVDLIESATEEQVSLKSSLGDPQELPEFQVEHYVVVDEDELGDAEHPIYYAPPLYWYPYFGAPTITYAGYPEPYRTEIERNIPDEAIALKDGAEVVSAEGEKVGKVERVLTSPEDRVTHFLISEGLLFKERKLIPTSWVRDVTEEEVHLAVRSRTLEELPEYKD